MFLCFVLALVWPGCLVFGADSGSHVDCWAAGPITVRRTFMSTASNIPGVPEPTTPAATPPPTPETTPPPTPAAIPPPTPAAMPPPKTRLVIVKLRDLPNPADHLDDFALRFSTKYTPDSLHDMAEREKLFGLLEALQIVRHADGKWGIVCGHRRIGGLHLNAKRGVPEFSLDMDVPCQEILDSSRGSVGSQHDHERVRRETGP